MRLFSSISFLLDLLVRRVLLKPDPEANPRGETAWFGIVTWIQPDSEVRKGHPRLVRDFPAVLSISCSHLLAVRSLVGLYLAAPGRHRQGQKGEGPGKVSPLRPSEDRT